jgi:hypothetical protein
VRKIILAHLVAFAFVFLCFSTAQRVIAQPVCPDFEDLTEDIGRGFGVTGFGSVPNRYAWSMAAFNGNIYVGTLNVGILGGGGEVWKYSIAAGTWTQIINNGGTTTGNRGFRNMVVFNDGSGDKLYIGSGVTNTPQLYEIDASDNWQVVETLVGSSIRGMAVHDDGTGENCSGVNDGTGEKLYIGTENSGGGEIYCYDGSTIEFVTQLPLPKYMVSALYSYNGNLYAGTWAEDSDTPPGTGFGLYVIQTSGSGGYTDITPNITEVNSDSGVMVLIEYLGYLYLGTMNWTENSPFSLIHTNNPMDPDGWVIDTTDGFGYANSRYAWIAKVFNNNLYVGVFNPDSLGKLYVTDGVGNSFDLCVDGGFDGSYNWGLRSMAVQGGRLFISTASVLTNYFSGGLQVWASLTPTNCTDTDGDGYSIEGGECGLVDCDDSNSGIYPGAPELCDNQDNQCPGDDGHGEIDEGLTRATVCGQGACASTGTETCTAGVWGYDTCTPGSPSNEVCNDGIDNDCDGDTDSADLDCPDPGPGACSDYVDKGSCNNDPNCDWVGRPQSGTCEDAGTPPPTVECSQYTSRSECNNEPTDTCKWNNKNKQCLPK